MSNIQKRIDTILEASESWLRSDNHYLNDAIDRTVREGYFSFEDVKFAIDALSERITKGALQEWATRA